MQDFEKVFDLTLAAALSKFRQRSSSAGTELCNTADMTGRVLSADISTDRELPPFNRVAMDGYACRKGDLYQPLCIKGSIAAGDPPGLSLEPGTCIRVMTGAVLPSGADTVVMAESTEIDEDGRMLFKGTEAEKMITNFSSRGEDIQKNTVVLEKGTILHAKHSALLSSIGYSAVPVFTLPRVGIISTGNEVLEVDSHPESHQIRNANAAQIRSQLSGLHIVPSSYGIAPDELEALKNTISRASADNDLVLMSGGVSMGDYDLVPQAMNANGFNILYDRVAVKPGKPTTFATSEGCDLFGLPGNPVSCFVIFELLVKPYIYQFMGAFYHPPELTAPMAESFQRSKKQRDEWIPVKLRPDSTLIPVTYHGSGHYLAIARADGMVLIPKGVSLLEKGTSVALRLFQ